MAKEHQVGLQLLDTDIKTLKSLVYELVAKQEIHKTQLQMYDQ